jgi:predicted transcriptional regulator
LPFCEIRLIGPKPVSQAYPNQLKKIGDHIRKRRLDLGLTQKQVAEMIGVTESSIYHWEKVTIRRFSLSRL